jgi:hypothetical protein
MTYNKKKKKRIRVDTIVFFFTNDRYFFYFNFDPLIFNFFDIIKSNLFFVKSSTNMMLEFFWDPKTIKNANQNKPSTSYQSMELKIKILMIGKKESKWKRKRKKMFQSIIFCIWENFCFPTSFMLLLILILNLNSFNSSFFYIFLKISNKAWYL